MSRRRDRSEFSGKRVLLVGLGVHGGGVATARWLVKQGAILRVTDTKTSIQLSQQRQALRNLPIQWHLGGRHLDDVRWAERVVLNPGVPPTAPEVRLAHRLRVPIDNEASIFVRHFPGTLIGVTGTRGKTTTTIVLSEIIRRFHRESFVSGNVRRVAMLDYLPKTTKRSWAVLELSSYQLEQLPVAGKSFRAAVLTNVKRDHLNRHGTLAAYTAIKQRIFFGQHKEHSAILNADDLAGRRTAKKIDATIWWFSQRLPRALNGITLNSSWVVEQHHHKQRKLFSLQNWHLPGSHNLQNMLAAVAAARSIGVPVPIIVRGIRLFRGVPYRQERIGVVAGHPFINDTAATSPDGTLAAIDVYPKGFYIVGGTDKDLDFRELAKKLSDLSIPVVLLPGTATVKLLKELRRKKYPHPTITSASMTGAVAAALKCARPGQPIVLSPGAASFGLFQHEFDRGDQFREAMKRHV